MNQSVNINDLIGNAVDKQANKSGTMRNSIVINDKTYQIKLLPWEDGIDLWENIMKVVLPSVGSGLDRMQHDELDGSPTTFTEAMINLSRNLDGSTLKHFSISLLSGATVDGKELDLSTEFVANYGAWKKLFVFALKENFSSFFEDGWASGLGDLMAAVVPVMTQPQD